MTPSLRQRCLQLGSRLVFDNAARFYAWLTWQQTWRLHCASLADFFPPSPLGRRLAILDLGIGPGVSAFGILDRRPDTWVVGLDFVHGMLRQARRYQKKTDYALDLVQGDVVHLPFADGSFDVVTHHSFLYLLSQRDAALDEMARVLKPGGLYVILEPNREGSLLAGMRTGSELRFKLSMLLWRLWSRGYGRFSAESLTSLLAKHGFCEIHIETTLGGLGLLCVARRGEKGHC